MLVVVGEGQCEVALMDWLIQLKCLSFTSKDILDRRVMHVRQPKTIAPLINILPIDEPITIYRIGDTQKDEFDVSVFGDTRSKNIKVIKICTKPEIEILIIINEDLFGQYKKVQNKMSPKEFVKTNVKGYKSFDDYIKSHNMVSAIKEYKRIKKHKKDEGYIADLLKK